HGFAKLSNVTYHRRKNSERLCDNLRVIPYQTIRGTPDKPLCHRRRAEPTSFSQLGDARLPVPLRLRGSGQQGAFWKGAASTRALFIVASTRTLPPNNKGLEFTLRIAADKGFWRQQNRTGVDSSYGEFRIAPDIQSSPEPVKRW